MTTTAARRNENRLTLADGARMADRLTATVGGWAHGSTNRLHTVHSADGMTLERVALAAIGCTAVDMRDSELAVIRDMVAEMMGETFDAFGVPQ